VQEQKKAQLERYNQAVMLDFDNNANVHYDAAKNEYNCRGFKTNISANVAKSLARTEMQFLVDNREKYLELIKKDPDQYTVDEFGIVEQFKFDLKTMNLRLDDTGLFEDDNK